MTKELKKVQRALSPDYPECLEHLMEGEDEEQQRGSREAFLKMTVDFLRKMEQEELADHLQRGTWSGPDLRPTILFSISKKVQKRLDPIGCD